MAVVEARVSHPRSTPRAAEDQNVSATRPSRAALEYLALTGAAPISLIKQPDGHCTIKVGGEGASAQWWTDSGKALTVARKARRFAGARPDLSTATAAVERSAAIVGATLTPGNVAIERAESMSRKLDSYLGAMRTSGALTEFNKQYKRRRIEATLCGRGFMTYAAALARLQRALIPILAAGGRPAVGCDLFSSIFPRAPATG